jgi:DNA-binding HxlR family transcriptional regulator/GNAT superfamily N-acetyltransferase
VRSLTTTKSLPRCPVEVTLSLIGDRWKVLILRELLYGTKRFGEIRKALGNVSTKVLTANLRSMEETGLLTRKVYPEVPPRVEYTLTHLGYSLKPVLYAMVDWGSNYKCEVEGQRPIRANNGESLLISKAEEKDFQEIYDLKALTLKESSLLNENLQESLLGFKKGFFLKATDENDKIAGVLSSYSEDVTVHNIEIHVHPNWQSQGIGSKLLEEIERLYPSSQFKVSLAETNLDAIRFFQSCGYEKLSVQNDIIFFFKAM